MSAGPASIRVRRRVEWMDTDAAGIYHWTTIARFMESAEGALFRALGLPARTLELTPRVSVRLEFRRPLRFGDEAWVDLAVVTVGRASLQYSLTVTTLGGDPVAEGAIVTCLLDPERGGSRPWPDEMRVPFQTAGRLTEPADRPPPA